MQNAIYNSNCDLITLIIETLPFEVLSENWIKFVSIDNDRFHFSLTCTVKWMAVFAKEAFLVNPLNTY